MATKGHTATAKNNSTYFSDLDKRLSTETSGEASAITSYMSGKTDINNLVDSLSQNKNLSLQDIADGLEVAGVPQRARQKFTSAIGKTRSRTATRLAGKEPPTKGQKLITSLMQRTTPYKGAPTAPKTASEALSQAIRKNHQLLQKQPINKEGVA
tara:strand:- start:219 stop:683 length:465 start_codon:yes stop_codon:yes gene_type:complete